MRKKWIIAGLLCLLLFRPAISVSAAVNAVSQPAAGDTIYIAGNPDLYPVEYYDRQEETYKGILPELYDQISQQTGLAFSYIRSGETNEQRRLARNQQVEVVSAHIKGTVPGLNETKTLLSFEKDGKECEVCIGFTQIADSATVSVISGYLETISDSELLALSLAASQEAKEQPILWWVIAVVAVMLVVILVLSVILIRGRRNARMKQLNSLTDPLTGIGNEPYFKKYYAQQISPATYSLYYIAYIAMEAQRIERYLGTEEAEEIQRYAANVLANTASDLDITARIDNGVFLYAFQCPSQEDASQKIIELVHRLNDYKSDHAKESHTLFRAGLYHLSSANVTVETASLNARHGYHYAAQTKQDLTVVDKEMLRQEETKSKLQRQLSDSLKNRVFKLHIQFIVDGKTGKVAGVEALSRWQNPEKGLLLPAHYIEPMKSAGLIDQLDFYIFEESCRLLEAWKDTDKKELWLSCNFTRLTVSQSDFLERFDSILSRFSFDRSKLTIELTEDSFTDNKAAAYSNVLALKKRGVMVALDDLGSGYSSLSDLCNYPIDIIKLDRHIVAKSTTQRGNALLLGIVNLAHFLGTKLLCEGVETETENTNVKAADCDYIQGFYYSRVIPVEEADLFLSKYSV